MGTPNNYGSCTCDTGVAGPSCNISIYGTWSHRFMFDGRYIGVTERITFYPSNNYTWSAIATDTNQTNWPNNGREVDFDFRNEPKMRLYSSRRRNMFTEYTRDIPVILETFLLSCSNSGQQQQTRSTMSPALNGGTCNVPTSTSVPCPVNCVMGDWIDSGACRSDGTNHKLDLLYHLL
jgi:hypothetical protein